MIYVMVVLCRESGCSLPEIAETLDLPSTASTDSSPNVEARGVQIDKHGNVSKVTR